MARYPDNPKDAIEIAIDAGTADRIRRAMLLSRLTRGCEWFGVSSGPFRQAAADMAASGLAQIMADTGGVLHVQTTQGGR